MRIVSENIEELHESTFISVSKNTKGYENTDIQHLKSGYLLLSTKKLGFIFSKRSTIITDEEMQTTGDQDLKEEPDAVVLILLPHLFSFLKFVFGIMRKDGGISMKIIITALFNGVNYKRQQNEWLSSFFNNLRINLPDFDSRYLTPKKAVKNNAASCGKNKEKVTPIPRTLIIAVLGWSGAKPNLSIEMYDSLSQKWYYLRQKNYIKRAYHGAVAMGGRLYVIGGFDGRNCYGTTFCFDFEKRCWSQKPRMQEVRCYVTALEYQNMIYAIGGYDGENRLRSCERFNTRSNRWIYFQSMNFRRSDASGTVHQDKIYMCGGFDGVNILKSVEMYDFKSNQWTLIAPLMIRRSGQCLISHRGSLYVLGGFDGISRLQTVERFSEEETRWTEGTPMSLPRSNFGAIVMSDQLYVIGGYNGLKTVSDVEKFDDKTQKWQKMQSLKYHRSALGTCVFEDLTQYSICSFRDGVVFKLENIEQTSP